MVTKLIQLSVIQSLCYHISLKASDQSVPSPFFTRIHLTRDSYWVIRGLLLCEMYNTTRGMIENMAKLVER